MNNRHEVNQELKRINNSIAKAEKELTVLKNKIVVYKSNFLKTQEYMIKLKLLQVIKEETEKFKQFKVLLSQREKFLKMTKDIRYDDDSEVLKTMRKDLKEQLIRNKFKR